MLRAARTICVALALALIAGGGWFYLWTLEEILGRPYSLSELLPPYSLRTTPGLFREFAVGLVLEWFVLFFPFGVGMIAAIHSLGSFSGFRLSGCTTRPATGVAVIGFCLLTFVGACGNNQDIGRLATRSAWPAVVLFFRPAWWRCAVITMSCWAGCVLCGMGMDDPAHAFLYPGLALTLLNMFTIYSEVMAKKLGSKGPQLG